jgi:hypothetical protein
VFRQPRDDFWRGAFVVLDVLGCPACEGDAGFERVEGEAAFVVGGCAREGEEGCRDEAACCLEIGLGALGERGRRRGRTVSATEIVSLRSLRRVATSWAMALRSSGGKVEEGMMVGR